MKDIIERILAGVKDFRYPLRRLYYEEDLIGNEFTIDLFMDSEVLTRASLLRMQGDISSKRGVDEFRLKFLSEMLMSYITKPIIFERI